MVKPTSKASSMELSSDNWISEWEFDDYDMTNQYNMDNFGNFTTQDMAGIEAFDTNSNLSALGSSSNGVEASQSSCDERPSKQLNTKDVGHNSVPVENTVPIASYGAFSQVLCFDSNSRLPQNEDDNFRHGNQSAAVNRKEKTTTKGLNNCQKNAPKAKQGTKRTQSMKKALVPQDHIMAERKRREKLNERFIALSALVPGLKKMDKATVLEDSIKYIKQLQENAKELEDQTKKKPIESIVYVKKSQLSNKDDSSSCDEYSDGNSDQPLADIEAKISEKGVLIRIHCDVQKGLMVKLLSEIEKLNLTVTNSSVLPFGGSLDITIITLMDAKFSMNGKDLMKNLQNALANFL